MIHRPVLLEETVLYLDPVDGGTYVDGTLGLGGHTRAILDRCGPTGRVIGFDQDAEALALARQNLEEYSGRVQFVHRNFNALKDVLTELNIRQIDGLLLDLGLSSLQLERSGRGFSFMKSEPLDMRMDTRSATTAADLVNGMTADELADIFYYYGEERQSRRVAAHIIEQRRKSAIESTDELAGIVATAIPKRFHPHKIHVATRVFQALRIAVNKEMESLTMILDDAITFLKPGARFCVISFHSLEDRLVKRKFRNTPGLEPFTKKPVVPGPQELALNPRARSAKLRIAVAALSRSANQEEKSHAE